MKKTNVILGLVLSISSLHLAAQTAGFIAITGIYADGVDSSNPDEFTFVVLDNIDGGTEIYFTDSGVMSDGTFRGGEGALKYTAPEDGLYSGSTVMVNVTDTLSSIGTVEVANNEFVGLLGMKLSSAGDQVIAFIGSAEMPTYIAAAQTNSTMWQEEATSAVNSALPTGLVDGSTAVALGFDEGAGDEVDNADYSASRDLTGLSRTEALEVINDTTNWERTNATIILDMSEFTFDNVLPVIYSHISLRHEGGTNVLRWGTTTESNNDYFSIEHSLNGVDFVEIGQVNGHNNSRLASSNYEFSHDNPIQGMHYYRLKQVDFDTRFDLSEVLSVEVELVGEMTLFPTATADQLNIRHNLGDHITINIFNAAGNLVETSLREGNEQSMDVSTLPSGQYFLSIVKDAKVLSKKFIKQ